MTKTFLMFLLVMLPGAARAAQTRAVSISTQAAANAAAAAAILERAAISISTSVFVRPVRIFDGRPTVKISEAGVERKIQAIPPGEADSASCRISRSGNEYYWESRDNIKMNRREAGAFVTFTADNGYGYVRVIRNGYKPNAEKIGKAEAAFDYIEHFVLGLHTVTYYGKEK